MRLDSNFKKANLKFLAEGKENFSGSPRDWYDFAKKCQKSSQNGWKFVREEPIPGDILINFKEGGRKHLMISMGTPQSNGPNKKALKIADSISTPHGYGKVHR